MDTIGYALQLFAIFIAIVGIVADFLLRFGLLKTLLLVVRVFSNPFIQRKKVQEYTENDAGDLLFSFVVVLLYLALTIGFFVVLLSNIFGVIKISWTWLIIWGIIVALYHLMVLPIQALLVRSGRPDLFINRKIIAKRIIWRYILNWFQSPAVLLIIEIVLSIIVIIYLPAWVIQRLDTKHKIDLSNPSVRAKYYSIYSLLAIFVGTVLRP